MTGTNLVEQKKKGRPVGASTHKTRYIADRIAASGFSPLDVMQSNMEFWMVTARKLERRLSTLSKHPNPDEHKKALKLLSRLIHAREMSEQCAVDAAPYVHPKLQAIAFSSDKTPHAQEDLLALTDDKLATIIVTGVLNEDDNQSPHRGPTIEGTATTLGEGDVDDE